MGKEMFFLSKGKVELLTGKAPAYSKIGVLAEGTYFGEIALVAKCKRVLSARALVCCEMNVLFREVRVMGDW
jgi:CRP-like cAMP-binding protein